MHVSVSATVDTGMSSGFATSVLLQRIVSRSGSRGSGVTIASMNEVVSSNILSDPVASLGDIQGMTVALIPVTSGGERTNKIR